jgi:hypothetical protein
MARGWRWAVPASPSPGIRWNSVLHPVAQASWSHAITVAPSGGIGRW